MNREEVSKESAHDCLASINFKREISFGILEDSRKVTRSCSVAVENAPNVKSLTVVY